MDSEKQTTESLPSNLDLRRRDEARMKVLRNRYRRRPWEIPKELVIDSLERHGGKLSDVADDLGVSFTMLASYVDSDKELQTLLMLLRESIVDKAESVLTNHLDQGSLKAATFALQTLGKDRGYVRRTEAKNETKIIEERTLNVNLDALSVDQLRELRDMSELTRTKSDDSPVIDHDPSI